MDPRYLDINDLLRQLEETKQQGQRDRANAERERANAERERERAKQAEARQAPTTLERYLRLVQDGLVSTLLVESNPAYSASGSVTSVNQKYYPLELRSWDDFNDLHKETFRRIVSAFADQTLFPSETDVLGVQRELSPTTRKDEQDIRPFVRSAIEKPAERIVAAYHRKTHRQSTFYFQNNAYSLEYRDHGTYERRASSPSKRRSPERKQSQPIPDRWGICEETDCVRRVCVGEYNAAHKVPDEGITQALAAAPRDLFLDVLRHKQSGKINSEERKIREFVAQIICQAYHYMIESGLLFGYITSGRTLILLKIMKTTPWVLHFHVIPVDPNGQGHEFETRHAPATQLVTFVLLALRETEMPRDWIQSAENCGIYQWPLVPPVPLDQSISLQPQRDYDDTSDSSENEDPADDDYNDPPRKSSQSGSHQQSPTSRNERRRSPRKPAREYCTQACLRGLALNAPLDLRCPNASVHYTTGKHPITTKEFCRFLGTQLQQSLDQNCECLDKYGLFGESGVLFKITLNRYGYTFVAKGVQKANEDDLDHEVNVYSHLSHLQGIVVPVCLGEITLVRPYPLVSMAKVTRMMLMSWAGTSLRCHMGPRDVDIEKEKYRTLEELTSAGVCHDDIRPANLAWNPEQQRVMAIDFNQATIIHGRKRKDPPFSFNPSARVKRRQTTDKSFSTQMIAI